MRVAPQHHNEKSTLVQRLVGVLVRSCAGLDFVEGLGGGELGWGLGMIFSRDFPYNLDQSLGPRMFFLLILGGAPEGSQGY